MKNLVILVLLIASIFININICAQDVLPEIASKAPSEWIKGEELVDRIQRNEKNGNFIGIVFEHATYQEKYSSDSYDEFGEILVEKIKKYFKVKNVELIDTAKLPSNPDLKYWQEGILVKYNWWDTKYKTVLVLKTGVGFYTARIENLNEADYYVTKYHFSANIYSHEFYLKKGKEKSNKIGSSVSVGIESSKIKHYYSDSLSEYRISTIRIPKDVEVMRLVQNNMEIQLAKFVSKKMDYDMLPELIEPNFTSDIGSRAENKPVDKESFTDKVNRIRKDGNSIGVVFRLADLSVSRSDDRIPMPEENQLKLIGNKFIADLNKTFNTVELFELVDLNEWPYGTKWVETKYKIIIDVIMKPNYSIRNPETYDAEGKYKFDFETKVIVSDVSEFYKKGSRNTYSLILSSPFNFGKYNGGTSDFTGSVVYSESTTLTEIDGNCDRVRGDLYVTKIEALINNKYPDFINKLSNK